MIVDTMVPEAFEGTQDYAGLIAVTGFLAAFAAVEARRLAGRSRRLRRRRVAAPGVRTRAQAGSVLLLIRLAKLLRSFFSFGGMTARQ